MEVGDEGEGQWHRGEMSIEARVRQRTHRLLEDARDGRLADPAQRQTAERDAKLNCRKKVAEILLKTADNAGSRIAFRDELFDARLADADQSKLGGDEEAVRQNQDDDGDAVKKEELRHCLPV